MDSMNAIARRAGVLYFVFMIVSIVGEFLFPKFMVPGDAAATARNIAAAETTYRISLLLGLVTHVMFIFLAGSLYKLFKDVDRGRGLLMVLLVSTGIAIALANLCNKFAPLVLLSGADYLSVFTKPQLDALALGFLRFHSSGALVTLAFWGLWLLPFGSLVMKSGFLPRVLGVLLMVAGFAYLTTSVASMVLPEHRSIVSKVMMPLYFGEVPIIFWLMIKGAGVQQRPAAASDAN